MLRRVEVAAGGAIVAAALAVDPGGLAPFGPLRYGLVSTLVVGAAAMAVTGRVALDRRTAALWAVLLTVALVATLTALDPLHAWIGTPDRRFGFVTWAVLAAAFVAGHGVRPAAVSFAAAVAGAGVGVYGVLELIGRAPIDVVLADDRLGGPFGQPAFLGATAVLLGPPALACRHTTGARALAVVGAAGWALALLGSQSRAALAGAAVVGTLAVARSRRYRRPLAALASAALVLTLVVTPVGGRVADAFGERGLPGRTAEWRTAARVIADHPLLGTGPEGYRIAFVGAVDRDYAVTYGRTVITDRAHSAPLDVAATLGLAGAAVWLGLVVSVAHRAWRATRRADAHSGAAPDPPGPAAALGFGVLGYLTQSLFLFPAAESEPVFWLVAGALFAATASDTHDPLTLGRRTRSAVAACLATGAVALGVAGATGVVADRRLAEAVERRDRADPVAALAAADAATGLRPDDIRAWFVAARIAEGPDTILAVDDAIERIEAGLERSPDDPALRWELERLLVARAARSGSEVDRLAAEAINDELLAEDPFNPVHHERRAVLRQLAGDTDGADAALAAAAALRRGEKD